MLDRQHLSILQEVSRHGGVTAAAEVLNITQSAVSHAIAKLEARHGVKLWLRKGRRLELTQAGEMLLALAERLLPELEHAERLLADMAHGRRGTLRIGMECHPCEQWLMGVVRRYLVAWPGVDLQVRKAFRFDGVAALIAREVDMLITPDPVVLQGLTFTPVFDYELVMVVHCDHVLAERTHVQPEDLLEQTLFTVPVTPERLDIFTRFLAPEGIRPARHESIESTDLMLHLVAANRGVTVLPDWLVAAKSKDLPLNSLRIGSQGLFKSINLGVRREDAVQDYIKGFQAIAAEAD